MKRVIIITMMLAMVPLTGFARGMKGEVREIVSPADGTAVSSASFSSFAVINPAGMINQSGFGIQAAVGGFDEMDFGGGILYGKGGTFGFGLNYTVTETGADNIAGGFAFLIKSMKTSFGVSAGYYTASAAPLDDLQLNVGMTIMPMGRFSLGIAAMSVNDLSIYRIGLKYDFAPAVRMIADFDSNDGSFGSWHATPGLQLTFGQFTLHASYGIGLTGGRGDDEFGAGFGVLLGKLALTYDYEGTIGYEHFINAKVSF